MSYNGSGTFVINSTGQPVVTGTVISSTAFNALTADLATGLSTALTKDGQTTPTANLPMGTFKLTGMGAGSAATDSASIAQVQSSFGSFLTVAGTDTITATVSPALTAYAVGQMFAFVAAATNTGAVTINISSLGAKSIKKNGSANLIAADLTLNYLYVIIYDGTNFQLVGVSDFANVNVSGVLTLSGAGTQLLSTGTGAWKMPVGTTGQRPAGAFGEIRANSTTGNPEWYDPSTSQWQQFTQPAGYTVNYLVVAGGGGGGAGVSLTAAGGGGGAGGLLTSSTLLSSGTVYTITIGAGGASNTSGVNSSISGISITSTGGGKGATNINVVGTAGGSGGGGTGTANGGAGTSGQGNAGGNGTVASASAGGGGAGAVGGNSSANTGGVGGVGASNSISGSAVFYGGGGGGGGDTTGGAGGNGGGGSGGNTVTPAGTAASANTGGGGGGSQSAGSPAGGAGGSGIVVIAYLGSQRGTGGTITSSGGYTIHTFTSSGTYNA